jgi:hypothetical protein
MFAAGLLMPLVLASCLLASGLQVEQMMAEQQRLLQCVPAAAAAESTVPCGGALVGSLLSQGATADMLHVSALDWPQLCKVGCRWVGDASEAQHQHLGQPGMPVPAHCCADGLHSSKEGCASSRSNMKLLYGP